MVSFLLFCIGLLIICFIYLAGARLLGLLVYRLLHFSPFLSSLLAAVIISVCIVLSAIVTGVICF